jgi:hypothetical protein
MSAHSGEIAPAFPEGMLLGVTVCLQFNPSSQE